MVILRSGSRLGRRRKVFDSSGSEKGGGEKCKGGGGERREVSVVASMAARSGLLRALRGSTRSGTVASAGKRRFSASSHDDAHETAKWEKITYAGIVSCTILPYPYLHIRNKEFPWGPDGLFETKDHHGDH
ncbi:unnamed protein product [Spirodela intermedia]|uniref:Uncharacterized protein n=1 Tax=Spirodela intermedia TaxID=51605 RepID=A0A7I8JD56_SPIIN|nr:unnamed protein product [Spirodela intermedia]CAA6667453.1 unnamed protein product [Spirodela intermedia]